MRVSSHMIYIHKCENTSASREGSCSEGPESVLKGMWVNRLLGSLASPRLA